MKFLLFLLVLCLVPFVSAAGTKTVWNDTFSTDAGWSGGTYDGANGWYDTTSSWGVWTSPDYDISNFTWVRWCGDYYIESAHRYLKMYIGETTGTTSDPHVLIDAGYVTKPEPGYTPDYTGSYGGWHNLCVEMNETNDKLEFFYDGTSRWSYTGTAFDWSGEDYLRFAVGELNGATEFRLDNSTVTALCDELPAGACDAPSTCSYSGSGNWTILKSDNCTISSAVDLMNNTLIFNGSGTGYTIIKATINNATAIRWTDAPNVSIWWSGSIRKVS